METPRQNPSLTITALPYGNPSGQPSEDGNPTVVVPTLERPASPTPLEGDNLVQGQQKSRGEPHVSGNTTYAIVVDKDLSKLATEQSETRYVEEEVVVLEENVIIDRSEPTPSICFSDRVQDQIDHNMCNAIIVRLLGRSIGYVTLLNRIRTMWAPVGDT
ncbi:hypothetical protein V6N12_007711 [Hibiscus sabdariffa]|uniref:Uncharacterized protein n=1 Tax=Hibiscus sabdariffa TaxID=183260 RepID=A0ABR2F2K6_9ROSI